MAVSLSESRPLPHTTLTLSCCIFWPVFGCCTHKRLIEESSFHVFHLFLQDYDAKMMRNGKESKFLPYSQTLVNTKKLVQHPFNPIVVTFFLIMIHNKINNKNNYKKPQRNFMHIISLKFRPWLPVDRVSEALIISRQSFPNKF